MSFAWPHLLWLALVPLGALAWEFARRRRAAIAPRHPKILRAEAGDRGLAFVASNKPIASGRRVRPWLCAGLVLSIVALARPQWGRIEEPVFDQSREIILAIDLSRSMLAQDVKPARLDRAKLLIQSLLEKLAGERVGLVVFSGTAFLQSPLSSDYEILREFLPSLNPDFLPEGGSNYTALLDAANQAFTGSNAADRFLVILSDGEATEDDWKARVDELKKKHVRVIGLGIGTGAGAMIPDGSGGFVKDDRGAVVLSKLESDTLQELARDTGGVYRDASTWIDLPALLKETVEAGRAGKFVEKNTVRLVERYQWPLAFGLWCLMVSLCFEFPVRPRPRTLALRAPEKGEGRKEKETNAPPPLAAAGLLLLLSPFSLLLAPPARAAATLANPSPASSSAMAEISPLGKMVSRLAAAPVRTARDWAELGRETVTWGSKLQSEQQAVPEGPVRDALAAVDLGEKLDAKTTDWPKLRAELEALLKKPDEQKQDQQKQDKNQDKQDKDQKDQNKQDQKGEKNDDQNSQQSQSPNDQKKDQQKKNQPFDQNTKPPEEQQPKPAESAFGDMKKQDAPPPPPPGDMQKVGGAPEQKELPPEAADPALALPLQKLDQLRSQDSPARLFELMEGERAKSQKKNGKDW